VAQTAIVVMSVTASSRHAGPTLALLCLAARSAPDLERCRTNDMRTGFHRRRVEAVKIGTGCIKIP
jgi:hypothetical protein